MCTDKCQNVEQQFKTLEESSTSVAAQVCKRIDEINVREKRVQDLRQDLDTLSIHLSNNKRSIDAVSNSLKQVSNSLHDDMEKLSRDLGGRMEELSSLCRVFAKSFKDGDTCIK